MSFNGYVLNEKLYSNPLTSQGDIDSFIMEGQVKITFPYGRMRMENILDPSLGQKANFVLWCPQDFPEDIAVKWDFWPLYNIGLAMLFFSATGMNGEDLFDPKLMKREGRYEQYYNGDINAYHASYFRHSSPNEDNFQTCNLRKSKGFHLVCQGADPIPTGENNRKGPYHMMMIKHGGDIMFYINELPIFHFYDDGSTYGPVHGGGKIGLRQMAPLIGEYANLEVFTVTKEEN
jgi:hypothetical protein